MEKNAREIKFRGKRIDNGEWVYGFYAQCDEEYDNGCEGHMYRGGVATIHYIIDRKGNSVMVDPVTVGQRTERKLKDGTELYEDDILKFYSQSSKPEIKDVTFYGVIAYNTYKCMYEVTSSDCSLYDFLEIEQNETITLVGNIYDNPELLGGE